MKAPPQPPHDGKLGLVASSGVYASGRPMRSPTGSLDALGEIQGELEQIMVDTSYLEGAPFSWVTLAILFEEEAGSGTEFGRINKTYGDLPLTVQTAIGAFRDLDRVGVKNSMRLLVIQALVDAGKKYDRPTKALRALLLE